MSTCYIVGAGEFFGTLSPSMDDFVIAADGGFDTLRKLGVGCDLFIGDMDSSVSDVSPDKRFPVEKGETDTYLAYLEGVKRDYTAFRVYGGVGGREDHTFANISLLLHAKMNSHDMVLVGNGYEYTVIKNQSVTLRGAAGKTLSVFAFGGEAHGVTILGAKYEASGVTLNPDFPLGVSNSFRDTSVTVSVEDGALLIYREV